MIPKNPKNDNIIINEEKFQSHKLMTNDVIIKLDRVNFKRESDLVRGCGSYLKFSHQQHQQTKEKRNKLKEANFCKFRFCPMCSWRRTRNITGQLLEALEAVEAKISVSYLFLTLTTQNPQINDLKATVKHLNDSFQRLSQTKGYKNAVLGHFKGLELLGDNTPTGEAHPHFHILLIVQKSYFTSRDYISQAKWTKMWGKALRADYTPIVHIQAIKQKKNSKLTRLQSAVLEVAKYAVKHTELTTRTDDDFRAIINQTKRMRFFSTSGILKEKINLLKADDDLINFKEKTEALWLEIEEVFYEWRDGNYFLKK